MYEVNHMDKQNAPDLELLFELADLFKVFGDSTRLRIMVRSCAILSE